MKKSKPTIDELRSGMTTFETSLLQEVWQYYRTNHQWPVVRRMYRDHGMDNVRKALTALGPSVGREDRGSRRWTRYTLSLLGVLLTPEGPALQKLLTRLFEFQRELFRSDPEREESKSEEIAKALKLSPEQTEVLGELVWLGSFGGGRAGDNGDWSMSAMDEAPSFRAAGDLSADVEEWVLRLYERRGAVFQDQHTPPSAESLSAFLGAGPMSQPQVSEIAVPLERFREKYPDAKKAGFLIMRFTATQPFRRIVKVIKATAEKHGLTIIRADDTQFHSELWGNVRTLLHGCGFGIAVYERINSNEPNANVGLEVGYLMAMNKPVLLLKDQTVAALQSDLTGKLYHSFDPHDPERTIPDQLTKWLKDNGIVVPKHR